MSPVSSTSNNLSLSQPLPLHFYTSSDFYTLLHHFSTSSDFCTLLHFYTLPHYSLSSSLRPYNNMTALPPTSDYMVTKSGTIPRLTHNNFAIWFNTIKYVLIGTDAWNIIIGREAEPNIPAVRVNVWHRNEYKDYTKRANKAVSLIYGSVTPLVQAYITGIPDPRIMWTTLQEGMNIVENEWGSTYLWRKFHHELFQATDTVDSYIGRVVSGARQCLTKGLSSRQREHKLIGIRYWWTTTCEGNGQ